MLAEKTNVDRNNENVTSINPLPKAWEKWENRCVVDSCQKHWL